jgi:membrane peptidoglycan carboxypeptidase
VPPNSYQLEKKYSKDEILEGYLNTIYFNNGVYGVGSAAQFYFSKPLKSLTLGAVFFLKLIGIGQLRQFSAEGAFMA